MKKIEIITRTEKLEDVKLILGSHNCLGLTVSTVMGCGRQKGHLFSSQEKDVSINLLPKICVMTVIQDEEYEDVMRDICDQIGTGSYGDGKVFVTSVDDVMRIRTGERGKRAL